MLQLTQNLKTGATSLEKVPVPNIAPGCVLIRTSCSLVSLGTERMVVEFGKASLLAKARQQPDKVKMVLDKIKSDGLLPTLETVFNKLDQPLPLGYCNVGTVVGVGEGVNQFSIGDRVASNGAHAEFVSVPKNLVVRIPDNVDDESAAFTVIGAIGLQGIRLCKPELGETIIVMGLGLIGLITAQLLTANGCRVIGIDIDHDKLSLARKSGILAVNSAEEDAVKFVQQVTAQTGADAVLITASAKGNQIISQAAQMSRKQGRIVLVGVVGLELNRSEFYEKELSFQVSCSYGPGRYDPDYEQKGIDYPLPYVRWTEKRNFEAILQALSAGQLTIKHLITQKVSLLEYQKIYDNMSETGAIASIIEYPQSADKNLGYITIKQQKFNPGSTVMGIIGAGNFTKMTLLPALKAANAQVKSIVSAGGLNAASLARKFNIAEAGTDHKQMLEDPEINLVMITTRHHLHAPMVIESLEAGKHVFVEKPLAINMDQLESIIRANNEHPDCILMVGFNRRFAPLIDKIKSLLGESPGPMNLICTMNAGLLSPNHWVHDLDQGGGRIIGEACHFIDLASYLCGSEVAAVCMNGMGPESKTSTDNVSILLKYQNGSNVTINYFSNGSKRYSKERLELHYQGKSLIMDNFRYLYNYGFKGSSKSSVKQDKGHKEQFKRLLDSQSRGESSLIPFNSLINTSLVGIKALESIQLGDWMRVSSIKGRGL